MLSWRSSSRDISATSSAQVKCSPSSKSPVQLEKCVCSRPSSFARSFMRRTKTSSLPHRCSAMATAQSLAETTAMHLSMSCTLICSPASR